MPDSTSTKTAGLFTRGDTGVPVPLAGVSIDADIRSFCATVVVAQRYVNHESTPIEAVYVFPLDDGAAVSAFEAVVDGTLVVGEIQERKATPDEVRGLPMFVANAVRGVVPVATFDGAAMPATPETEALAARFWPASPMESRS